MTRDFRCFLCGRVGDATSSSIMHSMQAQLRTAIWSVSTGDGKNGRLCRR